MVRCHVALGANLGDPVAIVQDAMAVLRTLDGARLVSASSLYRTAPVGLLNQPDFINAVVALDVDEDALAASVRDMPGLGFAQPPPGAVLPASTLLHRLFAIEARFGRQRSVKNAPRTLDLDLLLYGDCISDAPDCILPHPRLHERAFVLAPLVEIAPGLVVPGRGPAEDLLAACAGQHIERLA